MQKINIEGMAQTIVDIVLSQNQDEIQKNKYGVQYPENIIKTLNKVVEKCKSNQELKQHENRLLAWHEELKKIKTVSGKNKKDKNEKDPQKIIDYFRTKHTEAGNVPIKFNLDEITLKYPHFSEQEIATIIVFQEEWDQFLENINNANEPRKEKNNWQRILAPIGLFGGTAMSTAGVMLYFNEPAAPGFNEPAAPGYSVDVAKPVITGDVGSGATIDPTAVKPTDTDIPTVNSHVGRGGSSEPPMQQNSIGDNSNGTPITNASPGTETAPDASGGHELTGQQQLGMALLITGIVLALLVTAFCIYSEIQKQNEDENLPPVTPLKAPQDLKNKINQLAGNQFAGNQLAGNQLAGNQFAGNQLAGNQFAGTKNPTININNLQVDDDKNINDIDFDDIRSIHSTKGNNIINNLALRK